MLPQTQIKTNVKYYLMFFFYLKDHSQNTISINLFCYEAECVKCLEFFSFFFFLCFYI